MFRKLMVGMVFVLLTIGGIVYRVTTIHAAAPTQTTVPVITAVVAGGHLQGHLVRLDNPFGLPMVQLGVRKTDITARLIHPQYFSVAGEQTASGLQFIVQGIPASHGQRITMIAFGYDSQHETELIAVGTPSPLYLKEMAAHPAGGRSVSTRTGARRPTYVCCSGGGDPATVFNMETYFTDPAFIKLAQVVTSIDCAYTSSIVTSCSGWDSRWWLSDDGWYEVSHSMYWRYVNSSHAFTSTSDHFRNQPFCLGNWTDAYVTPNEADLLAGGSGYGVESTNKTGNCAWMLTVNTSWWYS